MSRFLYNLEEGLTLKVVFGQPVPPSFHADLCDVSVLNVRGERVTWCTIHAFTNNCAIKAISYPHSHPLTMFKYIEAFIFHQLKCSLIIGSDKVGGTTMRLIESLGDYTIDPGNGVWNHIYTKDRNHYTKLFRKELTADMYPINYFANGPISVE